MSLRIDYVRLPLIHSFGKFGGMYFVPLLDGDITAADSYSADLFLSSGTTGSGSLHLCLSVFGV